MQGCDINLSFFKVRFPICFETLNQLTKFCENGRLKVKLDNIGQFNEDCVRQMFLDIKSRRTVGKLSISVVTS